MIADAPKTFIQVFHQQMGPFDGADIQILIRLRLQITATCQEQLQECDRAWRTASSRDRTGMWCASTERVQPVWVTWMGGAESDCLTDIWKEDLLINQARTHRHAHQPQRQSASHRVHLDHVYKRTTIGSGCSKGKITGLFVCFIHTFTPFCPKRSLGLMLRASNRAHRWHLLALGRRKPTIPVKE